MNTKNYNAYSALGRELFPVLLKPFPDELLSSWLMRYARALLTKSHTFCKYLYPKENVWNRDVDLNASDAFIQELANRTYLKFEVVYNTTLKAYYPNLFVHTHRKWITPLKIYHRTRGGYGLMACPSCLRKDTDPFFRKKWRLSMSVVCPDCEIELVDMCPKCKAPLAFHRLEVGIKEDILTKDMCQCFNCYYDLRKAPIKPANPSLVYLQRNLYSILDEGFSEYTQYSHLYFDALHQILRILESPLSKLQQFDKEICVRSNVKYIGLKSRSEFDKRNLKSRMNTMQKISWIMEDWPERLIDAAKKTRTYSSFMLRDMKNPPYWLWRVINENLYVVYTPWRDQYDGDLAWVSSYRVLSEKIKGRETKSKH